MKSRFIRLLPLVVFTFFPAIVFAAEISYPKEPLRNDPIENGQSLYPGSHDRPLASENVVTIDYVPGESTADPDSAYGGFARTGTSEKNKLTFKNGHVSRFVLGGFSLQGNVKENSVVFSGGLAADAAIGKLCGGQTADGDLENNAATISGGKVVGDVYGGDADAHGSAVGNRVEITGGEFSGFVNGGGVSGVGIARNNRVTISGGSVGMGVSGGFAHFASGLPPNNEKEHKIAETIFATNSVLENVVKISGKTEITGNVSGGFILDSDGSADKNRVEISGGTIRGNVYGGRAYSGRADGNTVVISGGTIKDRDEVVYAGYVHKPKNSQAKNNTVVISGSPELETITIYGNNLPTWQTDGNTLNFKGFRGTVRGFSRFRHVYVDRNSQVTVIGDGPYEIHDLHNEGRLIFKNGKLTVRGKSDGKPIE